jgi:hypothetical protein
MKFCHFLKKSAIWDSAKWNRQYGFRQSGIRLKIMNDLADKISVSAWGVPGTTTFLKQHIV